MHMICGLAALACISCTGSVQADGKLGTPAEIFPDYRDVTVPSNIAPLNFSYLGEEPSRLVVNGQKQIKAKDGLFCFSKSTWSKLMKEDSVELTILVKKDGQWLADESFSINISHDEIDPYISYRLIPPGYQGWKNMGIYQRDLESYDQSTIFKNTLSGENCMNCHSYAGRNPEKMVFHTRADFGGTIVISDGAMEKLNTATDSTISALVYPYWHPDGKHIAFSVNKTLQSFFAHDPNRIEVFDSASDVVVYNTETHSIVWSPLTRDEENYQTFPTFSPDGSYLYFCSAKAVDKMPKDYDKAKYGIYRIKYDASSESFGDSVETICDTPADSMSASFPRISPDGHFLAYTRHGYGNFSIWHKDADIWMIDLLTGDDFKVDNINSDDVESYHCWSSDSRWMVFSSRRDDGLYTRPYITHIDKNGRATKPFLLPQKDPLRYYKDLMFSYNIPEFTSDKVRMNRRRLINTVRGEATDIKPSR